MNATSSSVNSFSTYNQFSNNFDVYGNIVLNISASSANQKYISIPFMQYEYDTSMIESLYDTKINTTNIENQQDILIVNQDLQNSYNTAIAENQALKDSLGDLVATVEANPSQAEAIAQKDLIIKLRMQLGQGKSEADFSTDFPYQAL